MAVSVASPPLEPMMRTVIDGVPAVLPSTLDAVLFADGAAITIYLNGTSDMTTATADTSGTFTDIGDDGSGRFKGDIAAMLLYNSLLSSGNRAVVRGYLGAKYGLAVV